MELQSIFTALGLGKHAYQIYEVLFAAQKPVLVTHIAQKVGISRQEVYRKLAVCIEKGFVKEERVGKRIGYVALSPQKVVNAYTHTVNAVTNTVQKMVTKKEREFPAHISYYSGPEGIRSVFMDVVQRMPKRGVFYRYTSERNLEKVNAYLPSNYRLIRDKKKLERLVISNPISGKAKKARLERYIKFFPVNDDVFDQNIIQLIYADSVAFINLNTEESYIIRDKDLARFQTIIFKQLFKKL